MKNKIISMRPIVFRPYEITVNGPDAHMFRSRASQLITDLHRAGRHDTANKIWNAAKMFIREDG